MTRASRVPISAQQTLACRITGGESTENEMFILSGQYYQEGSSGGPDDEVIPPGTINSTRRSDYSEIALPAVPSCTSSAGGHSTHMNH